MVKVYTRTGDDGTTHCYRFGRNSKDDVQYEAIGTVDELNSQIGMLRCMLVEGKQTLLNDKELSQIQMIQNGLFDFGGALATISAEKHFSELLSRIDERPLEAWIDQMDKSLPEIRQFILPGGGPEASQAHICRTVCRRAERVVVAFSNSLSDEPELITAGMRKLLRYVNRLSDFLFVLARYLNQISSHPEIFWTNAKPEVSEESRGEAAQ